MSDDLAFQQKQVEVLIAKNQKDDALQLLFDLIVKQAQAGNFKKAETLRTRLIEIDEMALNQIIKAAEVIEAEKTSAIDPEHLKRWAELYNQLTVEETNALYHSLEEINCPPEGIICQQGKPQTHLYFLESGEVELAFHTPEQSNPLARIEGGSLFGYDTFFIISVNTLTSTAQGEVVLKGLPQAKRNELTAAFPGLVSKLEDFCLRLKQPVAWLKAEALDRRTPERMKEQRKMQIQLIDKAREPVGKAIRADLIDYSQGGVSFYVKLPKHEAAEKLLHRRLWVRSREEVAPLEGKIDQIGTIRAVIFDLNNDYSIHLRFDNS
jgi:CRP/FNR family transcriptional regulator, cyclic AMP receptor protein